jgi:hydrogenase/urease accessory protein HupE
MTDTSPSTVDSSVAHAPAERLPKDFGAGLKTFLTAVMGLLSLLVFGLALVRKSTLWLWIAFVCAVISGVFLQLVIERRKRYEEEEP